MATLDSDLALGDVTLDSDLALGDVTLDSDLALGDVTLDVELNIGQGGALPYYTGSYEVTPRKVEQVLETAQKSMTNNVTVHPITYTEVSNPFGTTVAIGQE